MTFTSLHRCSKEVSIIKVISQQSNLQENVRLKVCNISWNGFGPEGGAAMGEALASNNSLLEIDISGNRLNSDSAVKMARTVSSNDNLRAIRVIKVLLRLV